MSATASHKSGFSCARRLSSTRRVHIHASRPDNLSEQAALDLALSRREAVGQGLAVCIGLACTEAAFPDVAVAADGKDFVTLPSGLKVLDIRCDQVGVYNAVLCTALAPRDRTHASTLSMRMQ